LVLKEMEIKKRKMDVSKPKKKQIFSQKRPVFLLF